MKKFQESIREQATKFINFKKRNMKLLANEQQDSYENAKICYICKGKFENKYLENKEHCKVTDHVIDNNSLFCMLMYDAIRSS